MKRPIIRTLLFVFVFSNVVIAHRQSLHQYITREAFKLLLKTYPLLANSEMAAFVGTTETTTENEKSWGAGKVVSGAWIEDEYDVVYHYGVGNVPMDLTPFCRQGEKPVTS